MLVSDRPTGGTSLSGGPRAERSSEGEFVDLDEIRLLALRDVLSGGLEDDGRLVPLSEESTRATG